MSIPRTALGLAVLLLVAPRTTAHEQYSTLGDLLHWYAHSAQTHPSLSRYTELREPGYEHAILPLATFSNYGAEEARARNKSTVMLVFGEHARELITCEVGLWFSRVLLGDTAEIFSWAEWPEAFKSLGVSPEKVPATVQGWVRRILNNLIVKVLPVENVDGRQAWESGNLCLRKTSKGVDLNRNYPFAFAAEPPHSEMFGGPHPFSEAQSRLVARIALEGGGVPKAYVNVHSGEWAVYSGWDSKGAVGPGLPADLSDLLIRSGDVCRCQAGPAGAVSNYLAFGTGMDFMYTQLGVPYALTYEVYGHSGPLEGGEPGRIPEGTHNRPLSDYPFVVDDGIARAVPRVEDLLGPPPQHHHQHHHQQHQRAREAHNLHLSQHHLQHQQRRSRAARMHAVRLRRSAAERADEGQGLLAMAGAGATAGEGGAGATALRGGAAGGGEGRRRRAIGARGGFGRWEDPTGLAEREMALRSEVGSGTGGGSRNLLEASASISSSSSLSSSHQAAAETSAASSFGALGGRSMRRRLAAAATASTDGSLGAQEAAAREALVDGGALAAGAAGRELHMDLSGFSGPDGPIVAMVRAQPGMHQSCFDMFNPPPGPAYRDVVSRWVVILLMTLDHVADPAYPEPSPHPLPGTVLAGAGVGGAAARSGGAAAFGRRRLMEASVAAGADAEQEEEAGVRGGGLRADGSAAAEADAAVTPEAGAGSAEDAAGGGGTGAGTETGGGGGSGGNMYGSAGFDRRVQQRAYEVDPVMRQHSLVVLVAICSLGVVFVPWFLCAAKQVSRPLPLATRRSRQQLAQPPLPQSRLYI